MNDDRGYAIHKGKQDAARRRRQGEVEAVLSLNGHAPAQPAPVPFTPAPEYTLRRQLFKGRYWYCIYVKHPRLPIHLLAMRREKHAAEALLERLRSGTVDGKPGDDVPF